MPIALWLLIVAAFPDAPTPRLLEADTAYACGFEEPDDLDFDDWPDGWTRLRGEGLPAYVAIKIVAEEGRSNRCLRIALDGGGAAVHGPTVAVHELCSYVVSGRVKASGLARDEAYLAIVILDAEGNTVEEATSERIVKSGDWRELEIGPFDPEQAAGRSARIELRVSPTDRPDLSGEVLFDEIKIERRPRLDVSANRADGLYGAAETPTISCRATSDHELTEPASFELIDEHGQVLATEKIPLAPSAALDAATPTAKGAAARRTYQAAWRPTLPGAGFYRVRVALPAEDYERTIGLAAFATDNTPPKGEFGWALGDRAAAIPPERLVGLIGQARVRHVKLPVSVDRGPSPEWLKRICDELHLQGVELTGVIYGRSPLSNPALGNVPWAAARFFGGTSEPWAAKVTPRAANLFPQVRNWQLGADGDASFVEDPQAIERVREVRTELAKFRPDVRVGIGWSWDHELPVDETASWNFLTLSPNLPLTADELATGLDSLPVGAARWVAVDPLPREDYDDPARTADLIRRMVAAKVNGATCIFHPDPFHPARGLLEADGAPTELFLPWRTAVQALAAATHVGRVPLSGGSSNEIFSLGSQATMIVWNDVPTRETMMLGDEIAAHDPWGRPVPIETADGRPALAVGPVPTFVEGVNEQLARWLMSVRLAGRELSGAATTGQQNAIVFKNPFPDGAEGRVALRLPDGWTADPQQFDFRAEAEEEVTLPFELRLPASVVAGEYPLGIEFEISATRRYELSVSQQVSVGAGDVWIEHSTELNERGDLVVEQRLINGSEHKVSFRCDLFASGRRRQQSQVIDLMRGEDLKTYRLPKGAELVGETLWLRAEEIGGTRVLNYRFEVTP